MFLCTSRLPSFPPGDPPSRASKNQITAGLHAWVIQNLLLCIVFKRLFVAPTVTRDRCMNAAHRDHGSSPADLWLHGGTDWSCSHRCLGCWLRSRRSSGMHWTTQSFMPSAHDGLQMQRGAQRASQASGSRADDARTSPLRCQAPSRREPDAQGLDAQRLEKTPVQAGDAKMVEACCKLAVQAASEPPRKPMVPHVLVGGHGDRCGAP